MALAGGAGSQQLPRAPGTGPAAQLDAPYGLTIDGAGDLYVTDIRSYTVREISPSGVVTTLAGLAGSYGSADGAGAAARFQYPIGASADGAGALYVADLGNETIRKITPAGVVTTLAGSTSAAGSQDGTGSGARFNRPSGLAVDAAGDVFVADTGNDTIRMITPDGVVTTVVGKAGEAGIRLGADGRLAPPTAVAVIGPGRLAIACGDAVVIATLP